MNHAYTGWQTNQDSEGAASLRRHAGVARPEALPADPRQGRTVGFLDVVRVHHPQAAEFGDPELSCSDAELMLLAIELEASSGVSQDARSATCAAGEAFLYSSARPHTLRHAAGSRQSVLVLPARELRTRLPHVDLLVATVLPATTPAMHMVRQMAEACLNLPFDQMDRQSQSYAARAVLEAVLSALALVPVPLEAPGPRLARFHVMRIKQFVAANLHDCELSVSSAAQALRMSPSHIHRLFESGAHTFSGWLWSERLAACRTMLEDPARAHLPVSQVAYSCGFNNASHFARMFRERYGSTPSAWRARQQ